MIKFVVAALWIAAVTVGSVYFSFNMQREAVQEPEPGYFGGLDYVKAEMISVPLLRDRKVHGYFLARLVYTAEPAKLKKLAIPAEALLTDQVYTYLYANPQIDFTSLATLDPDALRNGIRDSVNARVGEKLVHEVLIEQFDFLTKDDVRDNTSRRRAANVPAKPEPAKSGH